MSENLNVFKLLISSPSDTIREKEIIVDVVEYLNDTLETILNVRIKLLGQGISSHSSASGENPQDILSKQFGDDYDIYVGIFWKRFGTPTERAESGTIEEFKDAYTRFKKDEGEMKLAFYFNTNHTTLTAEEIKEVEKINEFKERLKFIIVYEPYSDYKSFERLFRCNITIFINELMEYRKVKAEYTWITEFTENKSKLLMVEVNRLNELDMNFDKNLSNLLSNVKIHPDLNLAQMSAVVIRMVNATDVMKGVFDEFDNIIRNVFNHISDVIVCYNFLSNLEQRIKILNDLKSTLTKQIEHHNIYLEEFKKYYSSYDKLYRENEAMRPLIIGFISVLIDAINNFSSYILVMEIYCSFINKNLGYVI